MSSYYTACDSVETLSEIFIITKDGHSKRWQAYFTHIIKISSFIQRKENLKIIQRKASIHQFDHWKKPSVQRTSPPDNLVPRFNFQFLNINIIVDYKRGKKSKWINLTFSRHQVDINTNKQHSRLKYYSQNRRLWRKFNIIATEIVCTTTQLVMLPH